MDHVVVSGNLGSCEREGMSVPAVCHVAEYSPILRIE